MADPVPSEASEASKLVRDIGKRIRQLRINRNLSQSHLPIDRSVMSKYENGHMTPSLGHLERLCDIFGITMRQFFLDELHQMFLWEIVPHVKKLTPGQKQHILNVLAAAPKQE